MALSESAAILAYLAKKYGRLIPAGGSDESALWTDELYARAPDSDQVQGELTGCHHIAFQAQDRAMVDAFHKAALAHGGATPNCAHIVLMSPMPRCATMRLLRTFDVNNARR